MKNVFIVNGFPGSGKDTFASILNKYIKVCKRSSVDVVKKIALEAGWDGVKDDKGRRLLADLKRILVEYDDLPLKYLKREYDIFVSTDFNVMLLDIREPEEIRKAKELLNAKIVFIENKNVHNACTNSADASIESEGYDYTVKNNGTLKEFEENIIKFIKEEGLVI